MDPKRSIQSYEFLRTIRLKSRQCKSQERINKNDNTKYYSIQSVNHAIIVARKAETSRYVNAAILEGTVNFDPFLSKCLEFS